MKNNINKLLATYKKDKTFFDAITHRGRQYAEAILRVLRILESVGLLTEVNVDAIIQCGAQYASNLYTTFEQLHDLDLLTQFNFDVIMSDDVHCAWINAWELVILYEKHMRKPDWVESHPKAQIIRDVFAQPGGVRYVKNVISVLNELDFYGLPDSAICKVIPRGGMRWMASIGMALTGLKSAGLLESSRIQTYLEAITQGDGRHAEAIVFVLQSMHRAGLLTGPEAQANLDFFMQIDGQYAWNIVSMLESLHRAGFFMGPDAQANCHWLMVYAIRTKERITTSVDTLELTFENSPDFDQVTIHVMNLYEKIECINNQLVANGYDKTLYALAVYFLSYVIVMPDIMNLTSQIFSHFLSALNVKKITSNTCFIWCEWLIIFFVNHHENDEAYGVFFYLAALSNFDSNLNSILILLNKKYVYLSEMKLELQTLYHEKRSAALFLENNGNCHYSSASVATVTLTPALGLHVNAMTPRFFERRIDQLKTDSPALNNVIDDNDVYLTGVYGIEMTMMGDGRKSSLLRNYSAFMQPVVSGHPYFCNSFYF